MSDKNAIAEGLRQAVFQSKCEGAESHDDSGITIAEAELAASEIDRLTVRVADLEAIVERLPKTADGVPITPEMPLWYWWEPQYTEDDPILQMGQASAGPNAPHLCYSTREAALAARTPDAKEGG